MATAPKTQEVAFAVYCPCGCGEQVQASDAGFTATTVSVQGCSGARSQGIVAYEMRKSWAYANAVSVSAGLQHRDGLVVFV